MLPNRPANLANSRTEFKERTSLPLVRDLWTRNFLGDAIFWVAVALERPGIWWCDVGKWRRRNFPISLAPLLRDSPSMLMVPRSSLYSLEKRLRTERMYALAESNFRKDQHKRVVKHIRAWWRLRNSVEEANFAWTLFYMGSFGWHQSPAPLSRKRTSTFGSAALCVEDGKCFVSRSLSLRRGGGSIAASSVHLTILPLIPTY